MIDLSLMCYQYNINCLSGLKIRPNYDWSILFVYCTEVRVELFATGSQGSTTKLETGKVQIPSILERISM